MKGYLLLQFSTEDQPIKQSMLAKAVTFFFAAVENKYV
jgi:hypothetical protein